METKKLFVPAYALDSRLRKSLASGDHEGAATYRTMLLQHESGAIRIAQAHSDYPLDHTNTNFTVTP